MIYVDLAVISVMALIIALEFFYVTVTLTRLRRYLRIVGDQKDYLLNERTRLLDAIRKHRDTRGDDRCYQDDHELYLCLPEGDTRPAHDYAVTIHNCERYIESHHDPRITYVNPEERIRELEAEAERLRRDLANSRLRTGQQSEIITNLIQKSKD